MIDAVLKFLRRPVLLQQFGGFLAVGALNTIITLLVYEVLLLVLHYAWAYATSFGVGFIYSTIANGKYVFRSRINVRKMGLFFLVCLFNLFVGLWVLHVLIASFGVNDVWAPLFVIAIMLPVNFLLSRFALTDLPTRKA